MRKGLLIFTALTLMFSITACGGNRNSENPGDTTQPTSQKKGEQDKDTLIGEWLNHEANLYIIFFEDKFCILARDGRNAVSTYTDDGSTLSVAETCVTLSSYSVMDGKLTMSVDGQDYVFERPVANPAIRDEDYKSVPSEWTRIAYYMESALGDTMAVFTDERQIYDTPSLVFSIPTDMRRWADVVSRDNTDERTILTFFGRDVQVNVQCIAHCYAGYTTEELLEDYAEDYPEAEYDTIQIGSDCEYEFARRTHPGSPEYLWGEFYLRETGDSGYTHFTITVRAQEEGVTGKEIWNDSEFVQEIFSTLEFPYAER